MDKVKEALKARYPDLHPLMFQRAVEKATTDGELFDLLETLPDGYPMIWDDDKRAFVFTNDLLQIRITRSRHD